MLMHSPRDAYVASRIVMHYDAVTIAAFMCIPDTVHSSYELLCIFNELHSTGVAFECICTPPYIHVRCNLSTRCILKHMHSYALKRILML